MMKKPDDVHESKIKYLWKILMSVNPDAYSRFSEHKLREGIVYLAFVLILSGLVWLGLLFANLGSLNAGMQDGFDKIENIEIDFNLTSDIELDGVDVLITEETNATGKDVIITDENITFRPVNCILFKPSCILNGDDYTVIEDPLKHKDELRGYLMLGLLLISPTLMFAYIIYQTTIILTIIGTLVLITFLVAMMVSYRIGIKEMTLIGIYASTPLILSAPIQYFYHNLYYIPNIIQVVLFVIGVMLVGKSKKKF
jgi:hypothetical protein